jgi:hypothetical protein
MLIEEYKRSLKMPEAEEVFDLIFFRPIGFVFVKIVYRLPITPNQVTVLSMLSGLTAAWYYSIGTAGTIVWGALWYAIANIFDCSDGQLARLQKSGTPLGRLVDGVADYISSIAIFLGIGIGLVASGGSLWWLVVLGGLSSALHAMLFDHYQSEYISTVRNEENFLEREVERFTKERHRLEDERRGGIKIFILKAYLWYLGLQKGFNTKGEDQHIEPERYREENRLMIRYWSFLGPTTNRTILIAAALIGRIDIFLWIIAIPANLWLLMCFFLQRQIHRRLETVTSVVPSIESNSR